MEKMLKKYAELAVKKGVNIQQDQTVIINSPIECADFAREIAKEAYTIGAKDVVVHYNDQKLQRIKLENSSIETLSFVPDWVGESYNYYARNGACVISISASDPDAYKGISMDKIAAMQKARQLALSEYYEYSMSNKIRWTVISIPTEAWALKIFPNVSKEIAVEKLWEVIFKVVRLDNENPIKAWEEHNKNLREKLTYLNNKNFERLHFKNNKGTDLTIELPKGHIWFGGSEDCTNGIEFNANMPTEEVFTLPKKNGVNGTVVSSKPLSYGGNLINNFSLTFKEGKVVDFSAEEGYEVLKELLESDEGARYLGEVALVPFDSPISNSNIIFYNTLFDENAACHLAFGKAYPICIENGSEMSNKELESKGVNTSIIHVDFMIGTEDLDITGFTENKDAFEIFKNGNWAF
ncbi:aminopeptidase [Clostridium chauvoei]|uniref:Aminopeptidase n=2 Tax=Clostridium chauvoei TaxID=46867 RepID=A0ABD4RHD7_9CLOT|nr:aminopeptidase [Clostridium chauvoei]ATD55450.1 aminopeptidase [Clostridium chauvoei]ATD56877.1 aminopeptidase [Clostridium chauvoei]MBX7280665.1 aminopeptidase [Clostridium chauvoei]MBX7283149.1 aminopeptidase [Clostridium chauvoei]MBX7285706.1 aminopeptidase [Clostridium chauvoei]